MILLVNGIMNSALQKRGPVGARREGERVKWQPGRWADGPFLLKQEAKQEVKSCVIGSRIGGVDDGM